MALDLMQGIPCAGVRPVEFLALLASLRCLAIGQQDSPSPERQPTPRHWKRPSTSVHSKLRSGFASWNATCFQRGVRNGTYASLMTGVVGKLSEGDVIDIAAYLASLEP